MELSQVGAWLSAGVALAWSQRQAVWSAVAQAMRAAEKAGILEGYTGEKLNEWLEKEAVAFFRRSRLLCWVPEWWVRGIIREICARQKKSGELYGDA